MTCNDEALVPIQSLPLHAIVRLTPPPKDLAVDYMVLVAGAEGHVIDRTAVETLYNARKLDFRATLTDLDFWCQLGIGDRKGGIDWIYPRWPVGCDVDREGATIRVVSKGTFEAGMGWFQMDSDPAKGSKLNKWHELVRGVWEDWSIDLSECADIVNPPTSLESHEMLTDYLSAADMCASRNLSSANQVMQFDISFYVVLIHPP